MEAQSTHMTGVGAGKTQMAKYIGLVAAVVFLHWHTLSLLVRRFREIWPDLRASCSVDLWRRFSCAAGFTLSCMAEPGSNQGG